jgi:hypothetical protein
VVLYARNGLSPGIYLPDLVVAALSAFKKAKKFRTIQSKKSLKD